MGLERSEKNETSRIGNAVRAAVFGAGMTLAATTGANAAGETVKTESVDVQKSNDTLKDRLGHISQKLALMERHVQEMDNFLNSTASVQSLKSAFKNVETDALTIVRMTNDALLNTKITPDTTSADPRLQSLMDTFGGDDSPFGKALMSMPRDAEDPNFVEKSRTLVPAAKEAIEQMRNLLKE